jgi:hypothetical protein
MKHLLVLISAIAMIAAACSSPSDAARDGDGVGSTTSTAAAVTTTSQSPVVSATTTPAPANEQDAAEIAAAYEIVFSSDTTYEEKSPLIDDPVGLEETVAEYGKTGTSMGGVALVAKDITVSGDTATVSYDLLFGGTPTYPDLTGDAVRTDGRWLITRKMFCSVMASARVGCP